MQKIGLRMSRFLLIGIIVSCSVTAIGLSLYLFQHGNDLINYEILHGQVNATGSLDSILHASLPYSSFQLMQLGILILVLVQVLRVGLVVLFFAEDRDPLFFCISTFILFSLIYSLAHHL